MGIGASLVGIEHAIASHELTRAIHAATAATAATAAATTEAAVVEGICTGRALGLDARALVQVELDANYEGVSSFCVVVDHDFASHLVFDTLKNRPPEQKLYG